MKKALLLLATICIFSSLAFAQKTQCKFVDKNGKQCPFPEEDLTGYCCYAHFGEFKKEVIKRPFHWDTIFEIPSKDKDNLYSTTKMYIAELWNSAQSVIQNDDKEKGIIIIKGGTIEQVLIDALSPYIEYTYLYTITFMIKDNKCRLRISDISCDKVALSDGRHTYYYPCINPSPNGFPGLRAAGLKERKYTELLYSLYTFFEDIISNYHSYIINTSSIIDEDW